MGLKKTDQDDAGAIRSCVCRAMLWIEAQSTPVIALLVFGVCYMLTAALAAILSRRAVAQDLKAVVPVTLTGVLGLVIVPLRVWMK